MIFILFQLEEVIKMPIKIKDYKKMPEIDIIKEIYDSLDPVEQSNVVAPIDRSKVLYRKIDYVKNEAAGYIDIVKDSKGRAAISIAVKPKFRREGIAYKLISRSLYIISNGNNLTDKDKWKGITKIYYIPKVKNTAGCALGEMLKQKFGMIKDDDASTTTEMVFYYSFNDSPKEKERWRVKGER